MYPPQSQTPLSTHHAMPFQKAQQQIYQPSNIYQQPQQFSQQQPQQVYLAPQQTPQGQLMQQPSNQHFPNYQGSVIYPYGAPQISSIFQPTSLTSLMYQLYPARGEDPSLMLKPMLLAQSDDRFLMLIGQQILKMQSIIEQRLDKMEPLRDLAYEKLLSTAKLTYSEVPKDRIEFKVYGSMITKLAIDTSDMDISIDGVIDEQELAASGNPRQLTVNMMERIHERLNALDWVEANHLISTATIPIIKLVINLEKLDKAEKAHSSSQEETKDSQGETEKTEELLIKTMKIDLMFNDILKTKQNDPFSSSASKDEIDSQSTQKCAEYIKQQITEHPFLKPLAIILKKYLALKNLNSPFQGTMSSYGIVLMILALLKDMGKAYPNLELQKDALFAISLGRAFTHFLTVYGEQFSTQYFCIDEHCEFVENHNSSSGLSFLTSGGGSGLSVLDPIDPSNNVGKQTYNFNLVQDQLNVTQQCLFMRFRDLYDRMAGQEELGRRLALVNKAIEQRPKPPVHQNQGKRKGSSHAEHSHADEQARVEHEPLEHVWSRPSGYMEEQQMCSEQEILERLILRAPDQLKADATELDARIQSNKTENEIAQDTLLDKIIMINMTDLSKIENDPDEDRQKLFAQFARSEDNYSGPLQRLQ